MVRAIPIIAIAMIALRVTSAAVHVQIEPEWPRGNLNRAAVARQLEHTPGQHLVLVRYPVRTGHDVDHEWVYNDADIDRAKTVWARDMGPQQNEELLRYFAGRKVWSVNGDESPPRLERYDPQPRL